MKKRILLEPLTTGEEDVWPAKDSKRIQWLSKLNVLPFQCHGIIGQSPSYLQVQTLTAILPLKVYRWTEDVPENG